VILLVTYKAIQEFLDYIAPPYLEEEWDNSGIQIKHNLQKVNTLLIGLDPTLDFVRKGIEDNADILISHHPLFFNPLTGIDTTSLIGKKVAELVSNQIGLLSIHTPFDLAENGLSQALAEKLNLRSIHTLQSSDVARLLRLVVFVPKSYENEITSGLLGLGLGKVGKYKNSYYRSDSEGFFEPSESASPDVGKTDQKQCTKESRLEFLLKPQLKGRAISKLLDIHPYEEPAYTLEKTERIDWDVGLGRTGQLKKPTDYNQVIHFIRTSFNVKENEIIKTGKPGKPINTIAVSPGAGGSSIKPALSAGVDLLVTGELDYHERLEAEETGLAVLELGHYNSEKIFVPWLSQLLEEEFSESKLKIHQYLGGKES